jgi:ABC-type transporter Mla subunit MlaD
VTDTARLHRELRQAIDNANRAAGEADRARQQLADLVPFGRLVAICSTLAEHERRLTDGGL